MEDFAIWLSETPASQFIKQELWVIPTLQSIHIIAIAAVVSSALFINLRLLNLADRSHALSETAGRFLPWIWNGLLILALTGIGLIVGEPERELLSVPFWIKMVLVLIGAGATFWFQSTLKSAERSWSVKQAPVRLYALGTLLVWGGVITAGRLIAYIY